MAGSSRIAVYSVPSWGADVADVAHVFAVADMEALALWGITDWASWGTGAFGLIWGADTADMEALALRVDTDWVEGDWLSLDKNFLNGLNRDDFFDCFPGGGFDMSTLDVSR